MTLHEQSPAEAGIECVFVFNVPPRLEKPEIKPATPGLKGEWLITIDYNLRDRHWLVLLTLKLFFWGGGILYVPLKSFSVMSGLVFPGWTST